MTEQLSLSLHYMAQSIELWVEDLFSYSFPSCSPRVTDVAFHTDQNYSRKLKIKIQPREVKKYRCQGSLPLEMCEMLQREAAFHSVYPIKEGIVGRHGGSHAHSCLIGYLTTLSMTIRILHKERKRKIVTQLCLTLVDPTDCNPSGSSVCAVPRARNLEWVATPLSRVSSLPRDRTRVSCIAGRFFST